MSLDVAIPPAYEGTGYRRVMLDDGTMLPGALAIELPAAMTATNEASTSTRPARTKLAFVPPTITGSRGGNVALANLLTALHNAGIIVNSTSA